MFILAIIRIDDNASLLFSTLKFNEWKQKIKSIMNMIVKKMRNGHFFCACVLQEKSSAYIRVKHH